MVGQNRLFPLTDHQGSFESSVSVKWNPYVEINRQKSHSQLSAVEESKGSYQVELVDDNIVDYVDSNIDGNIPSRGPDANDNRRRQNKKQQQQQRQQASVRLPKLNPAKKRMNLKV